MITQRNIATILKNVRSHMAKMTLISDIWLAALMFTMLVTAAVWYEKVLYLAPVIRAYSVWSIVFLLLGLGVVVIVRWLGIWRGWWPWVTNESLARRVGFKFGENPDRLLNAYQLEEELSRDSAVGNTDLLRESVNIMASQLSQLDFRTLAPRRYHPSRRLVQIAILVILVAWGTGPRAMLQAGKRLSHPGRSYSVPTPFILLSLSEDLEVLGGDTTEVIFTSLEQLPPNIEMVWKNKAGRGRIVQLPLIGNRYTYRFEDILDDVTYYGRFRNPVWFSHWQEVNTKPYTIHITDRPVIEELTFRITPPAHTGEPSQTVGGNVADINAMTGSQVTFSGQTNLPLKTGQLLIDDEEYTIAVAGRTLEGEFKITHSMRMYINIVDTRDVANANPIVYTFNSLDDLPPNLTMLNPLVPIDLDESMTIAMQYDVNDDYGLSQSQITYTINHPDYLRQDDQIYTHTIPELAAGRRSQRITHLWELGDQGLVPGDEIHFHVEIYDNNVISGPGKAISNTLIARLPTLVDMFNQISDQNTISAQIADSMLANVDEVRALLEEMELAFKADGEVSWEQQQKGKELLSNLAQVMAAMEEVKATMSKLEEMAANNNLFSAEILEKYSEFQNLLEQIISPEMEEAMANLRAALENMDQEQFKSALQNMRGQTAELENQLDRFIDIFQRALAEMRMDELVKRLEQLALNEEQLHRELQVSSRALENRKESNLPRHMEELFTDLQARHEEQERSLSNLMQSMDNTAELLAPYSKDAAERLADLSTSSLATETAQSLNRGTKELAEQDLNGSQSRLEQGRDLLGLLVEEANTIREHFQTATTRDMMNKFRQVLSAVLATSKAQEQLNRQTENLARSSPRVREIAETQHYLARGLDQIIAQMVSLSRESFHIGPEVGRAIGKARNAMQTSQTALEDNNPRDGATAMLAGMTALNETAMSLYNSLAGIEQSGSASGYEQYLQRMQSLSQGQQALNDQAISLQLGQMASMSRNEMMRRLAARQSQLAELLDELVNDYPNQTGGRRGGLGEGLNEMDQVIQDFKRRRITQRTLDRQQKILSRMLDSQKSLSVNDFKEERKGTLAQQMFEYDGPEALPAGMGARQDILMQAMERALRSGYSQEYQQIIRRYFQSLARRSNGDG